MTSGQVQTSVSLFGSPPWGFRLSGGKEFNQPLVISRVTPGSTADKGGLTSGDVLISVNGQFVAEMTQDECEATIKQAVGSMYLVLRKNAATVNITPSGEVSIEGDRSVYNDETNVLERMARHNRSAKPFPGSFTSPSANPPLIGSSVSNSDGKPAGFRSVSFRPKTQVTTPSTAPLPRRSQPDGSSNNVNFQTFNSQPKQFVPYTTSNSDLPPPPQT